ncbi:MAG: hypothetical protein KGN76_10270 [Acidobacteriota bacterium]|nr:hypothetical protein [Acidobacteriota bacterium]
MTRAGLERRVRALLDTTGRAFRPEDLVAQVSRAQHVTEAEVRAALWRLLDRKDVRLTADLKLAGPRRPRARR